MTYEFAASVIIPTRGGAQRLPRLIRALAAQDCTDFEVIPVLDGDIDGSEGVLDSLAQETGLEIRAVVFPENRGRSAALNAGIEASRGEVLIRCDDDLEPQPNYVAEHVRIHKESPVPLGVVGPCRNILPDGAYARVYGRPASEKGLSALLRTPPNRTWMHWAGNVSVTQSVAALNGGYDERYRKYGWEDVDYGYRLSRNGIKLVISPDLVTPHHMAATNTRIRALRALHSSAAQKQFEEIHGKAPVLNESHPASAWGVLVNITSKFITTRSIKYLGYLVDSLIPWIPAALGRKLVALIVESAGRAGAARPHEASEIF